MFSEDCWTLQHRLIGAALLLLTLGLYVAYLIKVRPFLQCLWSESRTWCSWRTSGTLCWPTCTASPPVPSPRLTHSLMWPFRWFRCCIMQINDKPVKGDGSVELKNKFSHSSILCWQISSLLPDVPDVHAGCSYLGWQCKWLFSSSKYFFLLSFSPFSLLIVGFCARYACP